MFKKNLLVFENEKVCQEALTYARELALRMDSAVTFLMLVEISFPGRSFLGSKRNALHVLEERVGKMFSDFSSRFLKDGIESSMALRVGDPAQEFLKFLAERAPFQAVIWGSGEELPDHPQLPRGHWLKKVITTLECPLLTVSRKGPGKK
jgi:hypothetical protein